jgi:hypothetical protein
MVKEVKMTLGDRVLVLYHLLEDDPALQEKLLDALQRAFGDLAGRVENPTGDKLYPYIRVLDEIGREWARSWGID